jgi:N-hydroxyarylamine O-acetyltransferase
VNIAAYLDRISYRGPLEPTAATLRGLHRAHMLAVPFENLDIHLSQPIVLDQASLFDKIVRRRRGGFCYELNGLFAALLRQLGFDVTLLAAGVSRGDGQFGPEFDHLTLLVRPPRQNGAAEAGSFLADVGFGDSFREPLVFAEGVEQPQGDRSYRLERKPGSSGERWTLHERSGGKWSPQYRFALTPRQLTQYAEMCLYHQTSPDSHFTRRQTCSLATPAGRVTLSDMRLIVTEHGVRTEHALSSADEHRSMLREHFGIDLDLV